MHKLATDGVVNLCKGGLISLVHPFYCFLRIHHPGISPNTEDLPQTNELWRFFTTVFLSRNYKEFAWWRKNRVWWCDGVIAWSAWWCNRCYRLKVGVLAGCTKDETYGGNNKPYSPFTLAQCTEWMKIHWTLLIGPAFQPFSTGPRGNETNLWFNPEISDCPDSNLMVS